MYAGRDYRRARRQAQANADQTGVPWVLWIYGYGYWVQRDWSSRAFEAEVFKPQEKGGR
jgi:hypothetical protein